MSFYNDPYRSPLPYEYTATWTQPLVERPGAAPPSSIPVSQHYAPLPFATTTNFPNQWPPNAMHPMGQAPRNFENGSPTPVPFPYDINAASKKRKYDEQTPIIEADKRSRPTVLPPFQNANPTQRHIIHEQSHSYNFNTFNDTPQARARLIYGSPPPYAPRDPQSINADYVSLPGTGVSTTVYQSHPSQIPQGTRHDPLELSSSPAEDWSTPLPIKNKDKRKTENLVSGAMSDVYNSHITTSGGMGITKDQYSGLQTQPPMPGLITPQNMMAITPSATQFKPSHSVEQRQKHTDPTIDDVVPIVEPPLCKEQADLVNLILTGRNVFYTGSAGCGKSTVLKAFVKRFKERHLTVDIVAPTGRAALDINGSTTWTYAGWTPDHHKKPLIDLKKAAHGKFVRQRMRETNVLVIDEISMVENLHFERLNAVMKEARESDQPFGGVQLIVTGDFCQLPPVKPFRHCITCGRELVPLKDGAEYKCRDHGLYYDIDKWAFRSQAWEECNFAHVNLTTIHRQSDKIFIDILNKLRIGNPLSEKDRDVLLKHDHQTRNSIMLFPTRAEVKKVNDDMFNKLRSQPRTYSCLDHFKWNEQHRHLESKKNLSYDGRSLRALADHRYEPQIQLKKGMLVVLLHNLDLSMGLVNGSQGTIQGFEDYDPTKMPKAAGKTINKIKERDGDPPHTGPTLGGDYAAFREQQMKEFIQKAEFKKWPIVTFLNGVTRTIYADCTVNELGDKGPPSLLSRTQIPLMAAWAMTTHKSQGMTLNRVRVDLAKAFEEGQAYVALSRARSLEGLQVISLPPPSKLQSGNPQVKEFLHEKFGL